MPLATLIGVEVGMEVGIGAAVGNSVGRGGDCVEAALQARIITAHAVEAMPIGSRNLRGHALLLRPGD